MPIESFAYKPKNTFWVTVESMVAYGCADKPVIADKRIYGLTRFGFIIGYEDKINAFVHRIKITPCEASDCRHAMKYELEIKYFVSCEIGIGINIGKFGTGVLGFPTRSFEEVATFTTQCECCDDEIEAQRNMQGLVHSEISNSVERRSAIPLLLSLIAVGVATALALGRMQEPGSAAEIFLGGIVSAMAASGIVAWRRYVLLTRGEQVRVRSI